MAGAKPGLFSTSVTPRGGGQPMTEKQIKIKESPFLPTPSQNTNPQNQIGPLSNNQPRDFPLWPAVLPGPWGRHQRSPELPPGRPIGAQRGGDRVFLPRLCSFFLYTFIRGFCLPNKKYHIYRLTVHLAPPFHPGLWHAPPPHFNGDFMSSNSM